MVEGFDSEISVWSNEIYVRSSLAAEIFWVWWYDGGNESEMFALLSYLPVLDDIIRVK